MGKETAFDYYYGDESSQFSFYRIPRELVTGDRFKRLSTDAKLLYGLLLDRMSLSAKNGWYDTAGRVFIYYTLEEIQEDLNCGHDKATKLFVELDGGKNGFGLIERVKQGQGRPTKIFVKRFTTRAIPPKPTTPEPVPRLPVFGSQDCGKPEVQTAEKPQSRVRESRIQDCGKAAASYIKSNQTDFIQLDSSIHPSVSGLDSGWMDRHDSRKEEIKENIEYETLCRQYSFEDVDEVVELMADVLCTTRPTVRIGGEDIPAPQAQERFRRLDYGHLEYVFDCLRRNTTQVRNIRAYLLTALYNAPATISNYYQAAIQHDFGP